MKLETKIEEKLDAAEAMDMRRAELEVKLYAAEGELVKANKSLLILREELQKSRRENENLKGQNKGFRDALEILAAAAV